MACGLKGKATHLVLCALSFLLALLRWLLLPKYLQFAIPKKSKSSSKSDDKKPTKPVKSSSTSTSSSASTPAAPRLLQLKSSEEAESACPKGPGFCVVAVLAGGEGEEVRH